MTCIASRTTLLALSAISFSSIVLADSGFDWNSLVPTDTLNWTPCYSGFECSRLNVPLDYSSPSAGNVSIAVTRYPSKSSKSEYLGPVLLNPGGPGGSGVEYVVAAGANIATVLGDGFDIVGFDPRGVSYSTPSISWFKSGVERAFWLPPTLATVYPSLNESSEAVAQQWARAQVQGQLAAERNQGFMQHMTTDNTARDMLRITEAFGWEKLQYWGISYGSVLGSTFASIFPDKVGRLVVDGVLDMESWYSANLTSNMADGDKALKIFADSCHAAGPDSCAFYANSSIEISANLDKLFDSVKAQPVPVITPISYSVFGFTLLKNAVFDAFYAPHQYFAPLAQGLADLAQGNASTIYSALVEVPPFECQSDSNSSVNNTYEAGVAIACGDAGPVNDTVSQLQDFYSAGLKVSSLADLVSNWRVFCSGWKVHREDRFVGPFGAPNTSFPLLVIGNTADPITPISGAKSTVELFPGSVLLTLDTLAHTSINAPSTCVYGYLRQYFRNGTLPAVGTVCTPDGTLFPSGDAGNSTKLSGRSQSELLQAGRSISEAHCRVTGHKSRGAV